MPKEGHIGLYVAAGGLALLLVGILAVCVVCRKPRQTEGAQAAPGEAPAIVAEAPASPKAPPVAHATTHTITPAPEGQGTEERVELEEPPLVVKRRQTLSEEELIKQAAAAPEVALDTSPARVESEAMVKAALLARAGGKRGLHTSLQLIEHRTDLTGLPLRRGAECRLPKPAAAHFGQCAEGIRCEASHADALRKKLAGEPETSKYLKDEAVPVLMQMLMPEKAEIRLVLAEHLARIKGKLATAALGQVALFDPSPAVREGAVKGLTARPAEDYRDALLKGLEHPWPVVADHAAEALVALKRQDAVPALVGVLQRPGPTAIYRKGGGGPFVKKELARVNHLRNCLLCHPPSLKTSDEMRGLVPPLSQPLSPNNPYSAPANGVFVRADITYLKQDLSVMLPVASPGKWPKVQRFDFFVRERPATPDDIEAALAGKAEAPQHQSALFALRELTGRDLGTKAEGWREALRQGGLAAGASPARP